MEKKKYSCLADIASDRNLTINQMVDEAYLMGLEAGAGSREDIGGEKIPTRYFYISISYEDAAAHRILNSSAIHEYIGEFSFSKTLTWLADFYGYDENHLRITFVKETTLEDMILWRKKGLPQK